MKSEAGSGAGELGGTAGKTTKRIDRSGAVPEGVMCPGCWGELSADAGALVCVGCGRRYPVVDGIPVLIVERAEQE